MDKRLKEIFLETASIEALSGNENKMAEYIISFLEKLNLNPYQDDSAIQSKGNCGNVLCPVGNGGSMLLLSHMDTARSTKDLKPVFHKDRITSDGTTVLGVDNRAGVACLLYAIEKNIADNVQLNDFTLAFTVQEETTLLGSQYLGINGNINMGFVFDSHLSPGCYICESAGSVGFKVRIMGKAAHSGLAPEKGVDSVKIAGLAISNIDLGRIDSETTANIGIIKGGAATNVVPELTCIEGEVRSMDPEKIDIKIEEIKNEFEKAAQYIGGAIEFETFWNFKPYKVTPDSDTYKTIEKTIKSVGISPVPSISKGGSDANSLNARGIPTVNLGIGAENPHSNDEYMLFDSFTNTAKIAMEIMKK